MKRVVALIATLALALLVPGVAGAAETPDLALTSAYISEGTETGTLYTFTESPDASLKGFTARLLDGDYKQSGTVEGVANSGTKVFYYILVDSSGSMANDRSWVTEFVSSLVKSSDPGRTVYSLGTFGDEFQTLLEQSQNGDEVLEAVGNIPFKDQNTEPYTAIKDAIEAQRGMRQEGLTADCLMNVIVITDGKVDVAQSSQGASNMHIDLQQAQDDTRAAIANAHDIVLHSVCVGQWDKDDAGLFDVLSTGTGCCLPAEGGYAIEAQDAAGQIDGFVKNEYKTEFHVPSKGSPDLSVGIRFASEDGDQTYETNTLDNVHVVDGISPEGDEGETGGQPEGDSESSGTGDQEGPEGSPSFGRLALPLGVAAAVGVCAVVVAVVVLRRKRNNAKPQAETMPAGPSVHIDVLVGAAPRRGLDVPLAAGATFGRDSSCDVPFIDPDMAPRHGRFFLNEGVPSVEPARDDAPIYLNGMRIFAANPLRDGDVVEAGRTQMRVTLDTRGATGVSNVSGR